MSETALVVVDVQKAFDDADFWGPRNNAACEENIRRLISAWRDAGQPLVFVRHDSRTPGSPLRPGSPGNAFKDVVAGEPTLLVSKSVHSAFHGDPDLADWLRGGGIERVVICGIQTNMCCETSARVGANLGFDVAFALDATHTFDRTGPDGTVMTADELARATATSLHEEFATIVRTADLV